MLLPVLFFAVLSELTFVTEITRMATNVKNGGGTMVAAMPETVPQEAQFGPAIAANMCGVDLIVRRPSGRVMVKKVEVSAADENGQRENLDLKKVTAPQFITDTKDDHEMWYQIDENARLFDSTLICFSVNDARRGFHLVPMSKVGALIAKLSDLRAQRQAMVQALANDYETWKSNLRRKFNGHFYLVEPRLPTRDSLLEKFDVSWTLQPLTPIDPTHLRFDQMNDSDRQRIIDESNSMAKQLVEARSKIIFDEVFGSVLSKCDEIAQGAMETGKRKFGSIAELVEILERLRNFGEWSNPDIIAHATANLDLLRNITDISLVNANNGQNQVAAAIKMAMKPLGAAITAMIKSTEKTKSRRRLEA